MLAPDYALKGIPQVSAGFGIVRKKNFFFFISCEFYAYPEIVFRKLEHYKRYKIQILFRAIFIIIIKWYCILSTIVGLNKL